MPWWVYERNAPHYQYGYLSHLRLNLQQAEIWIVGNYEYADIRFEVEVNGSWKVVLQKMFRFTKFRRTGMLWQ
jgi:hypothetical protein